MATRHERVVLDLEDKFTGPVLRAAAAASLLDKNLSGVGKTSTKTSRDVDRMGSTMQGEFSKVEKDAMRASRSSSALVDSIAMLGPAIVPLGAAAVPAIAGLTAELGVAAGAAGVAVLAFHGIGDALKAVDTYQLEPTTANLQKMQQEMRKIGPAGREFVRELDHMKDVLRPLQMTAREGLFPGLTDAMESLTTRIPQVQRIISELATTSGSLFADAGESLAGPAWDDFFNFLEETAAPTLRDLGETLGNVAHTAANLFMAFGPLESSFSQGLVSATQDLQEWSAGLSRTQGFHDFVAYVQESGPRVAEAIGKIANAFVQVLEAAAPMGGPILKALGAFADIVAKIADSPIGTPLFAMAAGLAAVNRALSVRAMARDSLVGNLLTGGGRSGIGRSTAALGGLSSGLRTARGDVALLATTYATAGARSERESARIAASSQRVGSSLKTIGKGAGVLGGLAIATSGAADGMGLTNTASMALMGTIAGPWGAAIGGGVGLMMDLSHAGDNAAKSARDFDAALKGIDPKPLQDKIRDIKSSNLTPLEGTPRFTGGRGVNPGQFGAAAKQADIMSTAQKRLNEITAEGTARLHQLGGGFVGAAAGARVGVQSVEEFAKSAIRMENALAGRATRRDFEASLDDMRASLRANGRTLDITTEKGRANQRALDAIAQSAINVGKTLRGADRAKFMQNARRGFIDAAVAAGRTRGEAKRLADRLISVGQLRPKPRVTLDSARAHSQINSLNSQIDFLARSRQVQIGVTLAGIGAAAAAIAGLTAPATKTITTVKKARGGWMEGPGGPTSDSIPTLLSDGEFVVNAAAAQRYGSELEWINAQGLRNGGYAGGAPSVNVATPSLDGMAIEGRLEIPGIGEAILTGARVVMADHADMAGARARAGRGGWG